MNYEIVQEPEARAVRSGSRPEWKTLLRDGKMLKMSQRPNWDKAERDASGMRMRTKAAPDGMVYVWLEAWVTPLRELTDDSEQTVDPLDLAGVE